ncbi:hypothetical protein A3218_05720 [Pseudomonas chlororaphis]|nr:hypothetical protein A3218_05720 [Pseudomonas chlororaphis]
MTHRFLQVGPVSTGCQLGRQVIVTDQIVVKRKISLDQGKTAIVLLQRFQTDQLILAQPRVRQKQRLIFELVQKRRCEQIQHKTHAGKAQFLVALGAGKLPGILRIKMREQGEQKDIPLKVTQGKLHGQLPQAGVDQRGGVLGSVGRIQSQLEPFG